MVVWTTIVATTILARMSEAGGARNRHFDSPQQEVYLNLWRTYDRLRALEDELFREYDLTAQQYNLLRLLRGEHPRPTATLLLASRLVSRAPDITRMLDKLETRKLIARQRSAENRRTVQIVITPAGLSLLKTLDEPLRHCHARQLGHLSRGQLKQLTELLREARQPHEPPDSNWR